MRITTLTEWLFYHLWKKNPTTKTSCPSILIPDTVIFRWASPLFWYFTTNQGTIARKGKDKIFAKEIHKILKKGKQSDRVLATYIKLFNDEEETKDPEIREVVACEYLNDEELTNLLF